MPGTPPPDKNAKDNPASPPLAEKKTDSGFCTRFLDFATYVFNRYAHDRMQQRAASLTFTTLLAIVPLLTVSFAIFAAFPSFQRIKTDIQDFIFSNFVPETGGTIQQYFETFMQQTRDLTGIGVIFLIITSVMLLMTISATFNDVWRVRNNRPLIIQLVIFWAVLTLAPIFFGVSLTLSSYFFAVVRSSGVEDYTGAISRMAFILPFLLQATGLSLMFLLVPNFPVRKSDALTGGFLAGGLLEILKQIFGFYITHFPTYETIYGAMAAVPIFLIWIYLSWIMVLLSAEMTASLPEWRAGNRKTGSIQTSPTMRLSAALAVLFHLQLARREGVGVKEKKLAANGCLAPKDLGETLRKLAQDHLICKTEKHEWVISKDLAKITLQDLIKQLGLNLGKDIPDQLQHMDWVPRLAENIDAFTQAGKGIFGASLEEILHPSKAETSLFRHRQNNDRKTLHPIKKSANERELNLD